MANVLWLQGGACSGNTMSFLNAEEPTVVELITDFGLNILWHPTTGLQIGDQVQDLLRDILAGKVQMDILVYEGSLIQGPNNTGTMNYFADRPQMDWIKDLSEVAGYVVAIGECASGGGSAGVATVGNTVARLTLVPDDTVFFEPQYPFTLESNGDSIQVYNEGANGPSGATNDIVVTI